MKALRTPDDRFAALADYAFRPRYGEVASGDGPGLRVHHVEEGPAAAAPVLLLHGEPSWSYLYRHIVSGLVAKGHRAIAPDLIGFGRSDKPTEQGDYSFERHVGWMSAWLLARDLRDITLFCQDWGGLIGLRLVAAFPERFARVVVANTGLPIGTGMTDGFAKWLKFSQSTPVFPVSDIVAGGCRRGLRPEEKAAYDAPFPDESYKAGARCFPALVPVTPAHASVEENKAAWKVLQAFDKPFLTAFGDQDPITMGGEKVFQKLVPGTKGQNHVTLKGGHFIQEDAPREIVELLDAFVRA